MNKSLFVKCVNSHPADKMCLLQTCQMASPICKNSECQYSSAHKKCYRSCDSEQIVGALLGKMNKYSSIFDKIILQTYDAMIKSLQKQKLQYQNTRPLTIGQSYQQQKIYNYLLNNKFQYILPSMVSELTDILNQQKTVQSKISQIKKNFLEIQSKFKDIINQGKSQRNKVIQHINLVSQKYQKYFPNTSQGDFKNHFFKNRKLNKK